MDADGIPSTADDQTARPKTRVDSRPNEYAIGRPDRGSASRKSVRPGASGLEIDTSEQLEQFSVGQVALIALHLIGDNKNNARFFYLPAEIDSTALSMQKNSQLAIATGWVEGGSLLLNDGQKRARSARASGIPYLKVEIIARPDPREGYLRSRAMNTERSDQTSLDNAVRCQQLLQEGVFKDQGRPGGVARSERAERLEDPGHQRNPAPDPAPDEGKPAHFVASIGLRTEPDLRCPGPQAGR